MLKKLKRVLGDKDYQLLKKPFYLSLLDSTFNGFNYGVMFIVLIQLVNRQFSFKDLRTFTIVLVVVNIIRYFLTKKTSEIMQTRAATIMANLRIRIGDYIRNINMGFFNKNSIGMITNTVTNDLNDLESSVTSTGTEMLKNLISVIYIAIFILIFNPVAGGIQVAILLLEIPLVIRCGVVLKRNVYKLKEAKSGMISRTIEYTSGIEVFKSYNLTGKKFKRLRKVLEEVKRKSIFVELSGIPYLLPTILIAAISFPIALYVSINMFVAGQISSEQLITFSVLSLGLSGIVRMISGQFVEFRTLTLSIDKLDTLLSTPQVVFKHREYTFPKYQIDFKKINFEYTEGKPVLKNVSFTAKEGEKTALVGASGSGKSTVLNLIARFWDVKNGEICLGGTNICEIYPDELLKNISMVFQDVYLLNDTVIENIRMGNNAITREQVIEAAKLAHCHEFISELEMGYDTVIKEGGKSLSGGEKQRISIARALIKDAPIVLLDEATASLDADNEHEIQKSIRYITAGKTVIVIAHRLNTIKDSDNILVFEDGEIVEQGPHQELVALNGKYAKMYASMMKAKDWMI